MARERVGPGTVAVVVALLLLAAGVRVVGLGRESLWFDEIESARLSDGGVAEVCHDSAASVHPPLYFLGLHLVRRVAGSADWVLRLPSVAASLAGLLLLYLLASQLVGRPAALLALALGAVNPLDVYYALEARMYAQAAALATLAAWLLWRWLRFPPDPAPGRRGLPLAYALTAVAMLYTHYLTALLLLAQGTFALAVLARWRRWREAALYAVVGTAAAVSFLPWAAYVRSLRSSFYADLQMDWMPKPGPVESLAFLGREPFWGLAGGVVRWGPAVTGLLVVAVLAALLVGLRRDGESSRTGAGLAYAGFLVAAPVGLAVAASHLYRPVFLPERFAQLVLAPLLVLLAAGCVRARPRGLGVGLAGALLLAMAAGTAVQARTPLKTDWRGLAREWPRGEEPTRLVCYPPFTAYCVGHYLGRPPEVFDASGVLGEAPELAGREVWVVAARDYPFELRPADAVDYRRLLALGATETTLLARAWRLDRVRVSEPIRP